MHIDTDFPNYYTASRSILEGNPAVLLYDTKWFQAKAESYGMNHQVKFSPFPPPTALVMVPVAWLSPMDALRVWTVVNIVLILGTTLLLVRILKCSLNLAAMLVLLSGLGLANCIRFGQLYIALSLSLVASYFFFLRQRHLSAGVVMGIFAPVKYVPMAFIGYHLSQKNHRRVWLGAGATILAIMLISLLVLGSDVFGTFVSEVGFSHMASSLELQTPFSPTFQSWDSLLRGLLVHDGEENPRAWVHAPLAFQAAKSILLLSILGSAITMLIRVRQLRPDEAVSVSYATIGITIPLLAPATATYHFVIWWLPIGLLLRFLFDRGEKILLWAVMCQYAIIGFLPYSFFSGFYGEGLSTVLAFPRLFLNLGIFVTVAIAIARATSGRSAEVSGNFTVRHGV